MIYPVDRVICPVLNDWGLENKHTGGKLPKMAMRLGFLIDIYYVNFFIIIIIIFSYNYLLKPFIGIPTQILIFLSAMHTVSLGCL